MIEEEDPYLARARAALAQPPAEDPYLARARAALADDGAGLGDYAAAPVRGAMEGAIGTLAGFAGMGDAFGRAAGLGGPEIAPQVRALRQYEPSVHPEVEQSLAGQLLEGAGQVGTMVAGSMLLPGAVQAGALGTAMGAQEFGRGQERALAAGASPQQADLAGLLDFPAGALQAVGPARAAGVLSRAWKPLAAGLAKSVAKEGGINALTGAAANAWTESVQQNITGEKDVQGIFEAAKAGLIPDFLIGGALGGAMRWSASRAGPLSPDGAASVDAASAALAERMAGKAPEDVGTQEVPAGTEKVPNEAAPDRPTLIEAPDEPLQGAAGRFQKQIGREEPLALHEAPEPLQERASAVGARVVDFDAGEALDTPGFYDRETGTIFLDKNAPESERRRALLDHEFIHHAETAHPEAAAEWAAALQEIAPKWLKDTANERAARQKALDLPGLSKKGAAEEARAEAAQGLTTVMDLLEQRPEVIARVAEYRPSIFRALADATIDFANRIGLTKRTSIGKLVGELDAALKESGTDFEKAIGAEKAARLAVKLRDLHRAMRVETAREQPKAGLRPYDEEIGPQPAYDEPVGPQKRDAEALASRKALKDGMPPEDAATALDVIDRRLEDALTGGESPDSPRIGELKKDRAAAVRLLYEGDPAHPALSKESPVDLWSRIVAEDERATTERRKEQEKTGAARTKAVQAAEREIDALAEQRRREVMKRVTDEQRAKQKADADAAKKERDADKKNRAAELKRLREDIKARSKSAPKEKAEKQKAEKPAKKPTKTEVEAAIAAEMKRGKPDPLMQSKFVGKEAPSEPRKPADTTRPEVEIVPEPPKAKLPVARRERIKDERLSDPHIRSEIERMAATADWETEGGKAVLRGDARNAEGHRGRTKWIPKDAWFKEIPSELKMNETDARHAIESALKDYPLGAKQKAFVEWVIDRADGEVYRGVQGDERAEARRAYDDMLERGPQTEDPNAEDAPFALRKQTTIEERMAAFANVEREGVNPDELLRVLRNGGRVSEAFPRPVEDVKTELRALIRMGSRAGPGRNPVAASEMGVRLKGLARLFFEMETALKTPEPAEPFQFQPSSRRDAFTAERAAQRGWLTAFQEALRKGSSDDEAAKLANAAHPEALRPAAFLGGLDDATFALKGERTRDGTGLQEFLRRSAETETHYAVTSKGERTIALRAASEEFWEKETRTRTVTERAAREMLASKAGKAEVDAAIRGQREGDWREQSALTVAAESRVNSLLRAAAQGTTSAEKAIDLAVDYYMLRSEQGRALSAVQRPRTPREAFYDEVARPSEKGAEKLSSLARKLRETSDSAERAEIKQQIAEVKKAEAKKLEDGMLALRKAGIDPEAMADTSVMAAHALRILNIARNKGIADALIEFRASAMVSHPATSTAALVGNVMNVGWNTVLTRAVEAAMPFKGGATVGEMRALGAALPGAWSKSVRSFWNVLRHDTPAYEADLRDRGLIKDAQVFENAKLASIPGAGGRIVRGIGLTPMTAVDEFARTLGSELEAVGIAYRRSGGDRAKMATLLQSPGVWEEAVKRTRRSIFQEQTDNPLVELGFKAREALDQIGGKKLPIGHLVFPFVKTGVNGLLEGLRKLPGPAQAITLNRLVRGELASPEARAHEAASNVLSLIVGATAWSLASARDEEGRPYITGTSTDSNDPPMSWQNGDGKWRSYGKLMPFATITATLVDAAAAGVDFLAMGHSLLKQGVDQTYFNTMSGLLAAIESDAPQDAKVARATRDFATSFIPNVARGFVTASSNDQKIDPLRKHEGGDLGVADSLLARIGGEADTRIDNFGHPVENGGSFLERYVSPSAPTRDLSDEHTADKVIRAWNLNLPEGEKPWVPARAPYWYEVRGETRYMTDRQYAAFQRRAGEIASSLLDESTLDPKNPTKAQIERIKRVLARARKSAKREVLRDIPYEEESE